MAEIRDYGEVQAEIVAGCQVAVAAALSTAAGQQEQARRWIDGGMPEGFVVTPYASWES